MCFSKLFRKEESNMQYTDNLNLNLPESDDYIEDESREALNDNFETLDTNVVVKGDFAVVTGTITLTEGEGSVQFPYPTGFTSSNCAIISCQIGISAFNCFVNVLGFGVAGAYLSSTQNGKIKVYVDKFGSETQGLSGDRSVQVILMKLPTE